MGHGGQCVIFNPVDHEGLTRDDPQGWAGDGFSKAGGWGRENKKSTSEAPFHVGRDHTGFISCCFLST